MDLNGRRDQIHRNQSESVHVAEVQRILSRTLDRLHQHVDKQRRRVLQKGMGKLHDAQQEPVPAPNPDQHVRQVILGRFGITGQRFLQHLRVLVSAELFRQLKQIVRPMQPAGRALPHQRIDPEEEKEAQRAPQGGLAQLPITLVTFSWSGVRIEHFAQQTAPLLEGVGQCVQGCVIGAPCVVVVGIDVEAGAVELENSRACVNQLEGKYYYGNSKVDAVWGVLQQYGAEINH